MRERRIRTYKSEGGNGFHDNGDSHGKGRCRTGLKGLEVSEFHRLGFHQQLLLL
jgi:hypothetical protein